MLEVAGILGIVGFLCWIVALSSVSQTIGIRDSSPVQRMARF